MSELSGSAELGMDRRAGLFRLGVTKPTEDREVYAEARCLPARSPLSCIDGAWGLAAGEFCISLRTWLVAISAALWGTDGLLRRPLSGQVSAATIVFWEHLVIVLALLPWLPSALSAFRAAPPQRRTALVVIGAGSWRWPPCCSPSRCG
jgi:hypothetical protein